MRKSSRLHPVLQRSSPSNCVMASTNIGENRGEQQGNMLEEVPSAAATRGGPHLSLRRRCVLSSHPSHGSIALRASGHRLSADSHEEQERGEADLEVAPPRSSHLSPLRHRQSSRPAVSGSGSVGETLLPKKPVPGQGGRRRASGSILGKESRIGDQLMALGNSPLLPMMSKCSKSLPLGSGSGSAPNSPSMLRPSLRHAPHVKLVQATSGSPASGLVHQQINLSAAGNEVERKGEGAAAATMMRLEDEANVLQPSGGDLGGVDGQSDRRALSSSRRPSPGKSGSPAEDDSQMPISRALPRGRSLGRRDICPLPEVKGDKNDAAAAVDDVSGGVDLGKPAGPGAEGGRPSPIRSMMHGLSRTRNRSCIWATMDEAAESAVVEFSSAPNSPHPTSSKDADALTNGALSGKWSLLPDQLPAEGSPMTPQPPSSARGSGSPRILTGANLSGSLSPRPPLKGSLKKSTGGPMLPGSTVLESDANEGTQPVKPKSIRFAGDLSGLF